MTFPDPDPTPAVPAFEGRLLDRPDDEVVDQGAGFDIRTLLSRRRVLSLAGIGLGALALAACTPKQEADAAAPTTSEGEIPEETNGPYPADGTTGVNVLDDSGIVRSDVRASLDGGMVAEGVPLTLTFALTDIANEGAALAGAALYMWQCDAQGRYSMYSAGVEDETFLRGIQVSNGKGEVTFTTIVPGCYEGRWTHIHFEVYPDAASATNVTNVIATSQLAFPPEMLADVYTSDTYAGSAENLARVGTQVADDHLFGEGDWTLEVPTVSGDAASGYTARLQVGIDTRTEPTGAAGGMGGGMPSGPAGAGGGPGGGGPGGGEPPARP